MVKLSQKDFYSMAVMLRLMENNMGAAQLQSSGHRKDALVGLRGTM